MRFRRGNQAAVGKGRPRRDALLDQFMEEPIPGTTDGDQMDRRTAFLMRLYSSAMDGRRRDHAKLMEMLGAWYFGKPRERLEMSGPGGKPIATEDATPSRRRTTGELRKRLDVILAKRAAHMAGAAASNGHSNGNGAHATTTNGETEEP